MWLPASGRHYRDGALVGLSNVPWALARRRWRL